MKFCFPALLLLLACALPSCSPDNIPQSPPAINHPLADTLAAVEADYEALLLPEALARARRLRVLMEAAGSEVPGEALAGGYQYLAMLHFEHAKYLDSVNYFTDAAAAVSIANLSITTQARQQLCRALASRHGWEWIEMDIACALGLALLESHDKQYTSLYGDLLIVQGRARKKRGDQINNSSDKVILWKQSGAIFRKSLSTFKSLNSPHRLRAMEQLGILYSRLPEYYDRVRVLARSIDEQAGAIGNDYVIPERLLGYWHYKQGRSDSSIVYYEKLLGHEGHFRRAYKTEPHYCLRHGFRATGNFKAAINIASESMIFLDCCPNTEAEDLPAEEANCMEYYGCMFELTQQADNYLQRYAEFGERADLERSFKLVSVVLDTYSGYLADLSQESTFYRLSDLGKQLTRVASEATFAMTRLAPDQVYYDALFYTMEMSKSYLLAKELSQLARSKEEESSRTTVEALRKVKMELTALKTAYLDGYSLDLNQLGEFASLYKRRNQLEAEVPVVFGDLYTKSTDFSVRLGIADVQQKLSPEQALITFSETSNVIYALYVDNDTVVAYTVDTAAIRQAINYSETIASGNIRKPIASIGRNLFDKLLLPVYSYMAIKKELLISPSQNLTALPFSALRCYDQTADSNDGYLIDRHDIRYVDSWGLDMQYAGWRGAAKPIDRVRVGIWTNPDLHNYLGSVGESLTKALGPAADHYNQTDCTTKSLLANSDRYDWLHLSVHARGNPTKLNDNYLYLSPTDSLNGFHIGGHKLTAQLVVLAACSTARGYSNQMDGTYSLRRSFHRAGVPDVISSLYEIPAPATGGLYKVFYQRMLAGDSPSGALAYAQRACKDGRLGERWRAPFYWAGVVAG